MDIQYATVHLMEILCGDQKKYQWQKSVQIVLLFVGYDQMIPLSQYESQLFIPPWWLK